MSRINANTATAYPRYLKPFWRSTNTSGLIPPDTEIGIKAAYYEGLAIPNETRDFDLSTYSELYDEVKANGTISALTDGRGIWVRLNPAVNGYKIENVDRPVITDIPTTWNTSAGRHLLFTLNVNNRYDNPSSIYVVAQWGRWSNGYALAIFVKTANAGESGSADDINSIWIPRLSDDSTKGQAISVMNDFIANCEFYILNNVDATSDLGLYNRVEGLTLLVKFGNSYQWKRFSSSDYRCIYYDSDEVEIIINPDDPTPEPPEPEDDPYGPGSGGSGYSGSGGGPSGTGGTGATGTGGLHDDTSDVIPIPIPPTDIITSAGLITAYNPNTSQLVTFANKLWNGDPDTIGDWFRLLFGGDAFNAIIGIHLLPVSPATSSPVHIKLGNWDTEAEAPKIINQYVQHTFGTIMLPEYWGNCIDYAPYTKIQLALPYIGIVDVDTDDVLGSQNTLTYNIDVYSGALCAMLRCIKGNLSSVIYQWSGSCGVGIPITGADKSAILSTVVAGSAITGAAGAIGGPVGAIAANAALAGTAASSYGTMKGKVQKQGNFSPNSGALGIMEPYFILTRPVQSVPSSWQADKGYPANISAQLGTLTGYTEVSEINLECSGTEAEKKEIIDLLKKGVLF